MIEIRLSIQVFLLPLLYLIIFTSTNLCSENFPNNSNDIENQFDISKNNFLLNLNNEDFSEDTMSVHDINLEINSSPLLNILDFKKIMDNEKNILGDEEFRSKF